MTSQGLKSELVSEPSRASALKFLRSPVSISPACSLMLGLTCGITIDTQSGEYIEICTNTLESQPWKITSWDVWVEQNTRGSLAYLISRGSWETKCCKLGRGISVLPGSPSDGLADLGMGGIKATPSDFFLSSSPQYRDCSEAWK